MDLIELMRHPAVKGAIAGTLAAMAIDRQAFASWKSFDDVKKYDWGLALFRWGQGAVIGATSALGLGWAL